MYVPAAAPAVNVPVPSIAPPPATTDQVGVNWTMFPAASLPTAMNNWVVPLPMSTGVGVTTMVASGPGVTTTVAVADRLPLVALIVLLYVPANPAAVNRPELLIVPPPATTDQVGVIPTLAPEKSVPSAVNCCVPLTASTCGFGVTVIDANVPGLLTPCTSHAAANSPATASTEMTRARRAFADRPFMMRCIELLLT